MELWVGPAIVAAIVSGLINAAGWFVTFRQSRRLEQLRRDERIHDFQVAIRAEIASDLLGQTVFDHDELYGAVEAKYRTEAGYSVLVPHLASNVIFEAVVKEIHVLPGDVIEPLVDYQRLRQTIERFAADLRAPGFAALPAERQLAMFSDYLKMTGRLQQLARRALVALDNSLGFSTLDGGQSSQRSAPASVAAAAEQGERNEP